MSPAVAEAIAWIERAEALLDQAHAALMGARLHHESVVCFNPIRRYNAGALSAMAKSLAVTIRAAAEEKD